MTKKSKQNYTACKELNLKARSVRVTVEFGQTSLSKHCKFQGWEISGLILISGLRTFILSTEFYLYTSSQDHPFVSK